MHKFFDPESVAVIGVPSKTGVGAFNNVETMLRYGYGGRIYPINPKAGEICGLKAYPSVLEIPEPADLALISVGRDRVLAAFERCIQAGIKRVVIISQGFSDADQRGAELQGHLVTLARENEVRITGPNTMGLLNNFRNFNTGFIDLPIPEKVTPVSLIAQTGFIQISPKDYAYHNWGMAIDIGNTCDVDIIDALEYFADDPETKVIAIHMEGIKRGKEFLEIASKITRHKPIVVFKTGRSGMGAEAALSHTGSLVGEDAVFDAAFDCAGVIRVKDTVELRDTLRALVCFDEMKGPNVGIVTVTGAGGIMAIDTCEEEGLKLAKLPEGLPAKLKKGIPDWIPVNNPIDIWPIGMIGGNYPGAVGMALTELLKSSDVDGVLAIIPAINSPLLANMSDLSMVVREAREKADNRKPIAMFPYGDDSLMFFDRYEKIEGVASFLSAEQAIKGLSVAYKNFRARNRESLSVRQFSIKDGEVETLVKKGREGGALTGEEALRLLNTFGIPVAKGEYAKNWEELETAAEAFGYPLVLKLSGPRFLHKSEWGGVKTGIKNIDELRRAFLNMTDEVSRGDPSARIDCFQLQEQVYGKELLLGLKRDPQFGQVIVCGMGGIYTEVFRDISREIVPVDRSVAEKMIKSLKMYPLLKGVRGEAGVDLDALLDALERLSFLAVEIPDLAELDINPLLIYESGCKAVDARLLW